MTDAAHIPAKSIAEALLDITGNASASGDFDAFASAFHLPNTITTASDKVIVEDREHLRQIFHGVRDKLRACGITELVRFVEVASYRSPSMIVSTHISHTLAGGMQVGEPYPAFSTIELIDGQWRVTASDYALKPFSPQEIAIVSARPTAAPGKVEEHS